ncbi:MAG TPA: glycerol kinase GlpK [Solirubrobacteraceae bacterium]|jgi:glycerol kinase|nr:glycerol kinase GlpK [Solirubrobacteraceae bacterium]
MILAIDQGTTGTTCIVFDEQAEPTGRAYREFTQHFPRPGWVEHDAREIWEVTQAVAGEALADAEVRPGELIAVGITNQRETVCVWDPATGEPLHRAIVWQDRRTAERCEELRAAGHEELVRARTGLVLDPYFSGTKIEWLLRNVEGLRERVQAGRAVFGTIDAWLIFKLCGEHVTDQSNASRTMLYDIAAGRWAPELLALLDIPERALPRVSASAAGGSTIGASPAGGNTAATFGMTRPEALHGHAVPVAGVAGDQQAALFGQACVDPGMGKNTYGTGSFALLNTGFTVPPPQPGLLSTVAWGIGGATTYALEASIFVTGAAVQWLRDGLGVIEQASDTEALAASLEGNDGVYFVPALTGLGSPHWDPHARGTIVGLTRGTGRAHLARASLEAIAYQSVDALRAMDEVSREPLSELRADGGASANAWLMQFQADVLGVPVVVPEIAETTALGAAYLAGVGVGAWTVSDVRDGWREGARYEPRMGADERETLLAGWAEALARARR